MKQPKDRIVTLPSFAVLGKDGSTQDGEGFIESLWNAAERGLPEVESKLKITPNGPLYWGLMSDFSRSFAPWENGFKDGLYLAGFELADPNFLPPDGWAKWIVPERRYYVEKLGDDYKKSFERGLSQLAAAGYRLAGAVFDHGENGEEYLYFPVVSLS
jgi:hypothetical protein